MTYFVQGIGMAHRMQRHPYLTECAGGRGQQWIG